ncbi:zinc finger C3H1 domain-containing protein-like [Aplochiton taeniatus]
MSEMQLRLLALQSASRKWQQKEQQVMKDSKEKITKASQEKITKASQQKTPSPGVVLPSRDRVTTRSASSAAASERAKGRTRSAEKSSQRPAFPARERAKPQEKERTKAAATPSERERAKPAERAKPGPKTPAERGRPPAKTPSNRKTVSPGSVAKQAFRKQQLRTWKLQQQREQEEKRRQEEERRKREDEIRKIRDLSNQDEQYNRFMKLVGGKMKAQSKSREREHRKSAGKQGLDTSGNLYQYDNYDEVAMETDSEPNSPALSPVHDPFAAKELSCFAHLSLVPMDSYFGGDFPHRFLSAVPSTPPPPPPPMPPPLDEAEQPPKPPFADEEEEEEMLLRETCLMSMANKRVVANEEATSVSPPSSSIPQPMGGVQLVARSNLSAPPLNTVPQTRSNKFVRGHHMSRAPLVLPRHKAVVVQLNDSDDSDSEAEACSSSQSVFGGLEFMIKEARRTAEASKPKGSEKENDPQRTPESLPHAQKTEYRLLKEEIASREKQRILKDHSPRAVPSPAGSDSEMDGAAKAAAELRLSGAEDRLATHRCDLQGLRRVRAPTSAPHCRPFP